MLVVTTFIYPYERLIDNSLDPGYLWSVTCWSCRGGWRRCTWCRGTAWTPAPACASHSSAQRSSHTLQFNIHNMDVITQVATLHWEFTLLSKIISCYRSPGSLNKFKYGKYHKSTTFNIYWLTKPVPYPKQLWNTRGHPVSSISRSHHLLGKLYRIIRS